MDGRYVITGLLGFTMLFGMAFWWFQEHAFYEETQADKVEIAGHVETVRLIGVDTPETVHPQKPVEYFGKEASAFTKRMAEGKTVRLEDDPQCTNRDRYGRLLRYVYLPDGKLLNPTFPI